MAGVLALGGAVAPASAATTTVYDSIPVPYSAADPSLGFGVTSTAELGQHIQLAGTDRAVEQISVGFTSWACETGVWNDGCATTPGATFDLPITLNVYAALADSDVDGTLPGAVLATVTSVVSVPFRPAADVVDCDGPTETGWFLDDTDTCVPGLAFVVPFDLSSLGVELPNDVIVSVAFDASADPGHSDALNVSLQDGGAPTIGTQPDPDNLFWNTSIAGYYTDGGVGGVGILRSDSGWSPEATMLIRVDVTAPAAAGASLPETGNELPVAPIIAFGLLVIAAGVGLLALRRRAQITGAR